MKITKEDKKKIRDKINKLSSGKNLLEFGINEVLATEFVMFLMKSHRKEFFEYNREFDKLINDVRLNRK